MGGDLLFERASAHLDRNLQKPVTYLEATLSLVRLVLAVFLLYGVRSIPYQLETFAYFYLVLLTKHSARCFVRVCFGCKLKA
jgi:hypothetical protein